MGNDNTYDPKIVNDRLKEEMSDVTEFLDNVDTDLFKEQIKLHELNERHALINDYGGKSIIMSHEVYAGSERKRLAFTNKDSFLLRYSNQRIMEGGKILPLGQWWLNHPERREFQQIFFDPSADKIVHKCYNTWEGFNIEPKPGSWKKLAKHIYKIISNSDPVKFKYFMRWMAFLIQHPGSQAEVAVVIKGKKGAGKGIVFNQLIKICGPHGMSVANCEAFTGQFNEIFDKCILLFIDEASWPGDKSIDGKLKSYITEPTICINAKNLKPYNIKNCLHMAMATNNEWSISATDDERRYYVNECDSRYSKGACPDHIREAYFDAILDQMNNGGREAMLYDLMRVNLTNWHPRKGVPVTAELKKQQRLTMSREKRYLIEFLTEGILPAYKESDTYKVGSKELYSYIDSQDSDIAKVSTVKKAAMFTDIGIPKHKNKASMQWIFPELNECRMMFEKVYGQQPWPNDEGKWSLTSSSF